MEKKYNIDELTLEYFLTTMIIVSKNKCLAGGLNREAEEVMARFNKHCKIKNEDDKECVKQYFTATSNYSIYAGIIISLYSEFEKYIKYIFNIKGKNTSDFTTILEKEHGYNIKDKNIYGEFQKVRMINNSIKHGYPREEFIKKYKELIVANEEKEDIYQHEFNFSDDLIDECCLTLIKVAKELFEFAKSKCINN